MCTWLQMVESTVGQVWNPCWHVRGVICGKKKKVNSITPKLKTCSVRVGGSLNLSMLTLLSIFFSGSSRLGAEGFPELYLHWFLSAKAWNEHCAVLFPSASPLLWAGKTKTKTETIHPELGKHLSFSNTEGYLIIQVFFQANVLQIHRLPELEAVI